jgi:hypothetical protein
VHFTTDYSPFKIIYNFNLITPLDLIPLLVDERVSLDGNREEHVKKTLHETVQQQIHKKISNIHSKLIKA